ncbi:hypothetical protein BV25DRAFT_1530067 [Artomyces pyxidatus]|uniref:Uncharacterized protein n=1 Tax=Artomyces pyxidatus TaxID=48021 RepID=A0ACB8TD27_9AGAM|nr:hypothetical protein BV25DRAFT_1530067 [Artomyces pyxidatus]
MSQECAHCELTATKRCTGCGNAWYCSAQCQRKSWPIHIFDCNPRKPINTAYYLARAALQDRLPEDPQTCEDYGFNKVFTGGDKAKLLGLYIGLLHYCDIEAQTLHKWRTSGTIVEEIKKTYAEIPVQNRGGYYPWFLEHQYVLDGSQPAEDPAAVAIKRAWVMTGGSSTASVATITAQIAELPEEVQACHHLYMMLSAQYYPSPDTALWITFGFCAGADEWEERGVSAQYQQLIARCSFEEFCAAYAASGLSALFRAHGLPIESAFVEDALSMSPRGRKSVWDLKQFVVQDEFRAVNSILVDYGFMFCRTDAERKELKDIYRRFFERRGADPLALHRAAISGKLYEYVGGMLSLKPRKKYEGMFKNPYPLASI